MKLRCEYSRSYASGYFEPCLEEATHVIYNHDYGFMFDGVPRNKAEVCLKHSVTYSNNNKHAPKISVCTIDEYAVYEVMDT